MKRSLLLMTPLLLVGIILSAFGVQSITRQDAVNKQALGTISVIGATNLNELERNIAQKRIWQAPTLWIITTTRKIVCTAILAIPIIASLRYSWKLDHNLATDPGAGARPSSFFQVMMTKTVSTPEAKMTAWDPALPRCIWARKDTLMRDYHDTEWGVPQHNGRMLWEMLMLEGFQAGLSWITVLRKRMAFREAFCGFDPRKVAAFTEQDVQRLLINAGIIRARAKIEATIAGARLYCHMEAHGESFSDFCWYFTGGEILKGDGVTQVASTPLSTRISSELKKRGFKFVGPTIVYAWMQAVGIVNDHSAECFCRKRRWYSR